MSKLILLTTTEFCKAIGITPVTLQRWNNKGLISPYLITPTGRHMYLPSQIDDYFAKYLVKPEEQSTALSEES